MKQSRHVAEREYIRDVRQSEGRKSLFLPSRENGGRGRSVGASVRRGGGFFFFFFDLSRLIHVSLRLNAAWRKF